MTNSSLKNLSELGQSAVTLDGDFQELERLSGQIDRLEIESDAGLERARQLLAKFGECGQRIGDGVQSLAKSLEEARGRAEAAAQLVSTRAAQIQQRHSENEKMFERFKNLGEVVRSVTAGVAQLKKPAGERPSEDEKVEMSKHIGTLVTQMDTLIEEARKLKGDAHASNMKTIERNADSLAQTLLSARRKLGGFAEIPHGASGDSALH